MEKLVTTADIKIDYKSFGITEEDINKIKSEKNIDNENRIIIGLIIGEIRRAFININLSKISFEEIDIIEIIEILKLPLNINNNFESFEDLGQHIFSKYDFEDIDNFFLNNQIQIEEFIEGARKFLNYIKSKPKFSDDIINSVAEL